MMNDTMLVGFLKVTIGIIIVVAIIGALFH
jgi:hypothetical protein